MTTLKNLLQRLRRRSRPVHTDFFVSAQGIAIANRLSSDARPW